VLQLVDEIVVLFVALIVGRPLRVVRVGLAQVQLHEVAFVAEAEAVLNLLDLLSLEFIREPTRVL